MAWIIAFCTPKFEVELLSNLAKPVAKSLYAAYALGVSLQGGEKERESSKRNDKKCSENCGKPWSWSW